MGRETEAEGRTVEEAVDKALEELGAERDEVEVEVLSKGGRGLFGLGSETARVKVTAKAKEKETEAETGTESETGMETATIAEQLLSEILDHLKLKADVAVTEEADSVNVEVTGEELGLLIGRHGETLEAVERILNIAARRKGTEGRRITLDIGEYRKRRQETIEAMARRAARRAIDTGLPVSLRPMNAFERRLAHLALQDESGVSTVSEGEEPNRQVKVLPVA